MDLNLIKSMTGYGRGEKSYETQSLTIELRAVNNRYLDTNIKMPRTYLFAEDAMKSRIQSYVARGKLDVFVTVHTTAGADILVSVNESLAEGYVRALHSLLERFGGDGVKDDLTVTALARFPDVIVTEKAPEDTDTVTAHLLEVLDLALADFNAMREREGQRLAEDILRRADTIEALTARIEARSPETVREYRARLEAKMAEVLQNTQIEESRLLTEAAIFADKVAVDEETVRLRSHLAQLRELMALEGAVGRKLDFLIQEFNREANTIGSKCNDLAIARDVVDLKAEIEKIREQVQNIE